MHCYNGNKKAFNTCLHNYGFTSMPDYDNPTLDKIVTKFTYSTQQETRSRTTLIDDINRKMQEYNISPKT